MRVVRSREAFSDVVDGHTVVCEPSSGEVYRLNATAAYLWELCDGTSVYTLATQLAEVFPDQDATAVRADTERFLESMCDKGLITLHPERP